MSIPQSVTRKPQFLGLCVAICVVLSGCAAQEELSTDVAMLESAPVPATAQEQGEAEQPAEESIAVEEISDTDEIEKEPLPVADSYEPPFPDRIDLFVAPKRQGRGVKKSSDGFENAVELLGFVNVDGQRVVLLIDGLVSPLAVGSQEAGIEVISIQPPAVVLQRGRQRWQVALEN